MKRLKPTRLFFWKRFNKRQRLYFQLALGALLVVLVPIVISTLRTPEKSSAAWFNDNWGFRQKVEVANTGSTLSNQRIRISLDTSALISAGKMKTDCADIRVTDINGKILEHWISGRTGYNCNNSTTYLYAKLLTIPSNTTIYVYYGNPSASKIEPKLGNSSHPGISCQDILDHGDSKGSGNYFITPSASDSGALEGYCDMSTSGGGWTLIISQQNLISLPNYYNISPRTDNDGVIQYYIDNDLKNLSSEIWVTNSSNETYTFTTSDFTGPLITNSSNFVDAAVDNWNGLMAGNNSPVLTHFQVGQSCASASCHNSIGTSTTYCNPVAQIWDWQNGDTTTNTSNHAHFGCKSNIETGWAKRGKWLYVRGLHDFSIPNITIDTSSGEETGSGPAAYWAFNEGYGTTANDSTSNKNNGTITGATWQTEDQCVSGKCLFFDGSTYKVETGAAKYDAVTTATTEFWFKYTGTFDANRAMFSRYKDGTNRMPIFISSSTQKVTYENIVASSNRAISSDKTITAGQWYHAAFTCGTGGMKMYINGVLQAGTNATTDCFSSISATTSNSWGTHNNSAYFKGFIDEAKIYNYVRTAAQIKTDYASRGSVKGVSALLGGGRMDSSQVGGLSQGLVGYWKQDEATWSGTLNEVVDSSGNANHGVRVGSATTAAGKFGNAGSFTPTTDDAVNLGSGSSLNETNGYTYSAWIYTNAYTEQWPTLLNKGGQISSVGYIWIYQGNNGSINYQYANGTAIVTVNLLCGLSTGTWQYLTVIHDRSNKSLSCYVNGIKQNTETYTNNVLTVTSGTAYIGDYQGRTNDTDHFNGKLDEVRIYNRALSAKEVSDLYNWAPGPIAYWNLEEGQGTTVNNTASASAFTGTWAGSGTNKWTPGKYGKGGKLNGNDDAVSITNYNILSTNLSNNNNFTYEIWAKYSGLSSSTQWPFLIGPTDTHIYPGVRGGSGYGASAPYLEYGIYPTCNGSSYTNVSLGTAINDGKWHHVAFTYDGTTAKSYLDGVYKNQATQVGMCPGFGDFYLGNKYNGMIDEAKVYNYARSAKQVVSDMNAGHPSVGSPVGSAVGYWKFDEGYGTTAHNSGNGGSALNGNLGVGSSAPQWTTNGKFGKALNFDGTDDYVSIPSSSSLNPGSTYTISAWVNPITSFSKGCSGGASCDMIYQQNTGYFALTSTGIMQVHNGTVWVNATSPLSLNQFQHVVVTSDGSNVNFYLNGKLDKSVSGSGGSFSTGTGYIGVRPDSITSFYTFNGTIDEVKIYNYALTSDEVKTEYNRGSSLVLGAAGTNTTYQPQAANQEYCIPGDSTSCAAPVGRWDFEEGNGGTVNDTTGNSNTGTWNGTGSPHWTSGKVGKGGDFNGSDDYVDAGNQSSLQSLPTFTVEAWVKPTVTPQFDEIVAKESYSNGGFILRISQNGNGALTPHVYTNTWYTCSGSVIPLNVWTHLVIRYDGTTLKGYMNGAENCTVTPTTGGSLSPNAAKVYIGSESTANYFKGKIDQVRIFNYARSAAQIAWDYNRGKPVGYWKFDECQGATAHDSGQGQNDGTITIGGTGTQTSAGTCSTSSTAWGNGVTGKRNYSLNFDGTDDYVDLNNPSLLTGLTNFTASTWIKASTTISAQKGIIAQSYGKLQLIVTGGKKAAIQFRATDGTFPIATSTTNVDTGSWFHLTGTWDGTTLKIYINGLLENSNTPGKTQFGSDCDYSIGGVVTPACNGGGAYSSQFFPGQIDDVRIFNYALTAAQVKDVYNGGAVNFGPVTGSP